MARKSWQNKPSKKQLERVYKLNRKILDFLPEKDSMRGTYEQMAMHLRDRINTYDKFLVNPYKSVTTQLKYNTEGTMELGDYANVNTDLV